MATIAQIFDRIFCDKELFAQYMKAKIQQREVEFFAQQGCAVTQQQLEEFQQQRQTQPGYRPTAKPLAQCPPFSEVQFFASLPQDGSFARQPGEEEKALHFVD